MQRGDEQGGSGDAHDGKTPIGEDEREALIPSHLQTREELNQWEALNISKARVWASGRRRFDALSVEAIQELHRRMFDETWAWAGHFRETDIYISPWSWQQVPALMRDAVANTKAQHDASAKTPAELDGIAARFHHSLVRIHPWPNGNGRHARLATELLLRGWGRTGFTWGGGGDLVTRGEARERYLAALRAADGGDFGPLMTFVRT